MSTHISKSIEVDTPHARVWDVFADYGGADAWHPYFERAYLDGEQAQGVGAKRICEFGPKLHIRETVVEWVANERMVIDIEFVHGMGPPIDNVRAGVHVAPKGDGDHAHLELTIDYDTRWGPVGWLMNHLMIIKQYEQVFIDMLAAAKGYAERGERPAPLAMGGSGRKISIGA